MKKTIKETKKKELKIKNEYNKILSKKIKQKFSSIKTKKLGDGMMEISFK
tara:strand:+ start:73 stop:222 length:150 start_codon:yes stop_codon:yes gene_type:complete